MLLLSRKTTTFGAGILAGYYGNVFASNIAYSMGYEAYSLQLTIFAVVLFVYDAPRLYNLLVARKYTIANSYRPVFNTKEKWLKKIARPLIAIFIIWLGVAAYHNYTTAPYKYPAAKGLPGAYGFYNVRIFKWNNQEIPYSATDLNRWQNVVFEKWATLSIKTAKPIVIDNGLGISLPIMITKETLSQLVWAEGVISPTVWTPSIINYLLLIKTRIIRKKHFN
ncbi:hypothetical protein KRR40_37115 [Niabella defluvii]|nr:hypothetical protein KRR40_37115 [Niabella sp. I65]